MTDSLEPDASKGACPVLRGEGEVMPPLLPDWRHYRDGVAVTWVKLPDDLRQRVLAAYQTTAPAWAKPPGKLRTERKMSGGAINGRKAVVDSNSIDIVAN